MSIDLTSPIRLHPLSFRREDSGCWIVGRSDGGQFIEVPAEAVTFLRELNNGGNPRDAQARVRELHGELIDAADFIETLIECDLVASLDDRPVGSGPQAASLGRLRPDHVRWVFSVPSLLCIYGFIVAGLVSAVVSGNIAPDYRAFFVVGSQSVTLAWNTVIFLSVLAIHEFWHLAAARADGVHARFSLGTRLQFLVAQTTVTGLWAAPRNARIRVYLAGITSDLVIASACSLVLSVAEPTGLVRRALEACILLILMSIAIQCALYIRADMYFVVQELLKCKNLYGDAWEYFRYGISRVLRLPQAPSDPTRRLARHERIAIKWYAAFMVPSSFITVGVFVVYGIPITVTLFYGAAQDLFAGIDSGNLVRALDGILVIAVEGSLQAAFLYIFIAKQWKKFGRLPTHLNTWIDGYRSRNGENRADHSG